MYVREWLKAPDGQVALDRRCPECEWTHMGIPDAAALDALDRVLEAGDQDMVTHLRDVSGMDFDEWNSRARDALARENEAG